MQSVGIAAALKSMRFALDHNAAFIRLVMTWTSISFVFVLLFSALAKPANVTLAQQLQGVDQGGERLLVLLISMIGNLAVSVAWVRYIILDEEPRNPFAMRAEMGSYFGRSIQIGILAILAALPGVIVGFTANSALGSAQALGTVVFVVSIVLASACALTVYARLQVMLALTALGENTTVGEAIALTAGHTFGLIGGWFLSYLIPFAILVVVEVVAGVSSASGFTTVAAVAEEFLSDVYTFMAAGLAAGFMAYVLLALDPRHGTDKIAREFA